MAAVINSKYVRARYGRSTEVTVVDITRRNVVVREKDRADSYSISHAEFEKWFKPV